MTGAVTKADIEREMVESWQALGSAVDSFSDVELEQPGVVEGWTVKDLLGHIAFWAKWMAESLKLIAEGNADLQLPDSAQAIDAWNERERQLRRERSLAEVREEWLQSFQDAMEALADFPADRLEEKEIRGFTVLQMIAANTYEHYREHLAQLNAWRRELETTET